MKVETRNNITYFLLVCICTLICVSTFMYIGENKQLSKLLFSGHGWLAFVAIFSFLLGVTGIFTHCIGLRYVGKEPKAVNNFGICGVIWVIHGVVFMVLSKV